MKKYYQAILILLAIVAVAAINVVSVNTMKPLKNEDAQQEVIETPKPEIAATSTPEEAEPTPKPVAPKVQQVAAVTSTATTTLIISDPRAKELLERINSDRKQYRKEPLTYNMALENAAKAKATNMANNHYFAHVGPDGANLATWANRFGYPWQYLGENLAQGQDSIEEVEEQFMASPSHRANILGETYAYAEIGIGMAVGQGTGKSEGKIVTFVAVFFGKPR